MKPIYLFSRYRFRVAKIVKETENVTSVYITGNNINSFSIKPGQFMILRFLNKKFWWQAHPFSLSQRLKNMVRVSIKNSGDFTAQISQLKINTPIIVDGPYGTFTADSRHKNKLLFIAGGIGITPIRSLIEQMAHEKKDIILLYSNRTKGEIVFKKELDELAKEYNFKIHYILTQEKDKNYIYSRIDQKLIKQYVFDLIDREIYMCGPILMMDSLLYDLKILQVPSSQIHFEKFAL